MGFEFQALENEIRELRARVRTLERFAPSGVVQSLGIRVSSGGTDPKFDGPGNGLYASMMRINGWAWISYSGICTDATGVTGAFAFHPPFSLTASNPAQYDMVGRSDIGYPTLGQAYDCANYVFGSGVQPYWTMWTVDQAAGQSQVGAAAPTTFAIGCTIRGFVGLRIAPGN